MHKIIKPKGFSLLEVMVTTIIISVSLLGMIALQGKSVNLLKETQNLSIAHNLAEELGKRLWSNLVASQLCFADDGATTCTYLDPASIANGSIHYTNCYSTIGCSPDQQAQVDLYEINNLAATLLPNGQIKICNGNSSLSTINDCNDTTLPLSNYRVILKVAVSWKELQQNNIVDKLIYIDVPIDINSTV